MNIYIKIYKNNSLINKCLIMYHISHINIKDNTRKGNTPLISIVVLNSGLTKRGLKLFYTKFYNKK